MMMVDTELRLSSIHGLGIFMVEPVARGELIWQLDSRLAASIWCSDPQFGEAWIMLATTSGHDIQPYHNRPIVCLRPADYGRWLDPVVRVAELCRPLPAGSLAVEQVR